MQKLQSRADELKLEQLRLKQAINEKNTASILVGLFQSAPDSSSATTYHAPDPRIDALLKRKAEDIPDASKIPELPALILPGQHNKLSEADPEDGIDYALLGKDRSSCSPAELDKIRRERNRMHAKRTRDRKRIFMEEMEVMIRQLEEENMLLECHLSEISGGMRERNAAAGSNTSATSSCVVSPEYGPVESPLLEEDTPVADPLSHYHEEPAQHELQSQLKSESSSDPSSSRGDFLNQIESLLAAAGAFEKRSGEINAISCAESDVTASTNNSEHNSLCGEENADSSLEHVCKKQRMSDVPSSITTTKLL